MAQANEGNIGVGADVMGDYDAICLVLQLCTEGEAKGDVGKLGEAFHADARMFGAIAGTRYDVPIEELFELAESAPADTGNYLSRILSVAPTCRTGTTTRGCSARRSGCSRTRQARASPGCGTRWCRRGC